MFELLSLVSLVLAIIAMNTARGLRFRFDKEMKELHDELKKLFIAPAVKASAPEHVVSEAAVPFRQELPVADTAKPETVAPDAVVEPIVATAAEPQQVEAVSQPNAATTDLVFEPVVASATGQNFENVIAARWSVWIGGVALAFAGIFAVKYSIEQGLLSPKIRLLLATLFGLALMASGEWVRRRTRPIIANAFQNAMIPGILTAAGTVTLFSAIYIAHGFYGFFGSTTAFFLFALVSFVTLGLSFVHGQGLAGLGLVGSFITPAMVEAQAPNPWGLFSYLTIVWVASTLACRIRHWRVVPAFANLGLVGWAMLYIVNIDIVVVTPVTLALLVMLAGLGLIWPGKLKHGLAAGGTASKVEKNHLAHSPFEKLLVPPYAETTLSASVGVLFTVLALSSPPLAYSSEREWALLALLAGMLLLGALRRYAVYPAVLGAIAAFAAVRMTSIYSGVSCTVPDAAGGGMCPPPDPGLVTTVAFALGGLMVALASLVNLRSRAKPTPFAIVWSLIGTAMPLLLAGVTFFFFGNYSFDATHGSYGLALGLAYLGASELAFRKHQDTGGYLLTRDLFVAASWAGFTYALIMFTEGMATTLAVSFLGFAYLLAYGRIRNWASLPWGIVVSAIFLAGRIAWEPTIVGALHLSKTPVFNELLIGYGTPSLLLIMSAWLMRNSSDGRLRNVLEALASLFTLLTFGILVRHAMNGGVLDSSEPTLAEQALYTLLTVGASATLMSLDFKRPSIIFRYGAMALGYVSMAAVLIAHFLTLNPYFTSESTGKIIFFNLILLAYLLPGIAYGLTAHIARYRRPMHYVISLALTASVLIFAYITLSVRRIYQGADISDWKGFLQSELYTYSAVWLVFGILLLVVGYRFRARSLRIASAALLALVTLKVFLIDVYNLGGLYRVISLVGLGLALIAIGRFYQTILSGLMEKGDKLPEKEAGEKSASALQSGEV